MRSHSKIIADAGGASEIAQILGAPYNRVRQWPVSDSIPAPYWTALVSAGVATLHELAAAAELKRPSSDNDTPAQESAA